MDGALFGNAGMGIHRKLPHLGDAGRGSSLRIYMESLSARLRGVRVACGDWSRVLCPSVTFRHGTTGVLLDPPYDDGAIDYSAGGRSISASVREWAIENGENRDLRIALCGYEGEHAMPESWTCIPWKAHGGYGSQGEGDGRENSERERIWFSPHCLPLVDVQPDLFGGLRGSS